MVDINFQILFLSHNASDNYWNFQTIFIYFANRGNFRKKIINIFFFLERLTVAVNTKVKEPLLLSSLIAHDVIPTLPASLMKEMNYVLHLHLTEKLPLVILFQTIFFNLKYQKD